MTSSGEVGPSESASPRSETTPTVETRADEAGVAEAVPPPAVLRPLDLPRLRRTPSPRDSWSVLRGVLLLYVFLLGSNVALAIATVYGEVSPWAEVVVVLLDAIVVGACAWRIRGPLAPLLRADATRGVDWAWTGGLLVAAYVFMWGYMAFARLMFEELAMLEDYREQGWPLWSAFALIAISPPLLEEFAFRGYILERLQALMAPRDANILQAALFSILHCSFPMLPSHFVMGLALGWLRLRTRSLIPGIVLHAAWNALVVIEEVARDGYG